ncbi:LAETG motif-containing sortase-dependent surface protein [Streptomyces sp. NPDC059894]|uniref:LAETG motif-containing sortase-dependent surface protein n=1 Tax=unclassified Streptomyces TaxID=2593676 RepID=UPI00364C9C53
MSSARRPLLTAAAAGTLLGALWFVPNANATQDAPARTNAASQTTRAQSGGQAQSAGQAQSGGQAQSAGQAQSTQVTTQARAASTDLSESGDGTRLADTGSFDTTPYVAGGTTLLALGAGFVVYSVRRERLGF